MKAKQSFMDVEFGSSRDSMTSQNGSDPSKVTDEDNELIGETAEEKNAKEAYMQMLTELETRQREEAARTLQEDEFTVRWKKAKVVAKSALEMAKRAAARRQERLSENDALMVQLVVKAGQSKIWTTRSNRTKYIEVETPSTEKAKGFANAYLELVDSQESESFEERFAALQVVVDMLEPMEDCSSEKRELLSLIAREADFTNRDVKVKNLSGLRRRITATFLRIIRSPDINPEIARFDKQLPLPLILSRPRANPSSTSDEQCLGCMRHLPRGKFPLSSGAVVGRCCNCEGLYHATRSRQDLGTFREMLESIKKTEEEEGNTTSPVFQIQDSDIRYIVENFWDSQSVLSGNSTIKDLNLVRWDCEGEWTPWNCVLLTNEEIIIHSQIEDLAQAYGDLLIQKVRLKHTLARNHFSKLTTMAKYFSSQHGTSVAEKDQERLMISGKMID